jgi:hypothetical protein
MADAQDLKSWDPKGSCGFDSHPRHQPSLAWFVSELRLGRPMGAHLSMRSVLATILVGQSFDVS